MVCLSKVVTEENQREWNAMRGEREDKHLTTLQFCPGPALLPKSHHYNTLQHNEQSNNSPDQLRLAGESGWWSIHPAEYQPLQQRVSASPLTAGDAPAGLLGAPVPLHRSHPSVPVLHLESKSSSRALRKVREPGWSLRRESSSYRK